MSSTTERRRPFLSPRAARIVRIVAFVLVLATIAIAAIVAQGFDVKQAPLRNPFVWAINASEEAGGEQYARVNTDLGEIDTVRPIDQPSDVLQTSSSVLVMTTDDQKFATVDMAEPQDFSPTSDHAKEVVTAQENVDVQTAGEFVAYLGRTGAVSVARITEGGLSAPVTVDPNAREQDDAEDEEVDAYVALAIAVTEHGILYSYSAVDSTVLAYDVESGELLFTDTVQDGPEREGTALTAVGDQWMLFEPADEEGGDERTWTRSHPQPTTVTLDGTARAVQHPSDEGETALIASNVGLAAISLDEGTPVAVNLGGDAFDGLPARPMQVGDSLYAAWLPASPATQGALWSSAGGEVSPLPYVPASGVPAGAEGPAPSAAPEPAFRSNGSTTILNDAATGWVWTVPDGALVPSSQNWNADETSNESAPTDEIDQAVVKEEPPQAMPDEFGVRANSLVSLPVLLNDSDPNGDVITVQPDSISALDKDFGRIEVTTDFERISVRVAAGASGKATFTYAITDGSEEETATVTLNVAAADEQNEPQWCNADQTCEDVTAWPSLEVTPGGSGRVDVLSGWVDPEGDGVYVASATKTDPDAPGSVAVNEDGSIFYQHSNPNERTASATIAVTVSDARGAVATKELEVLVTEAPALAVLPFSIVTRVDQVTTIDPSPFVRNSAGVFSLANATPSDPAVTAGVSADASTIAFEAPSPGTYTVGFDVGDAVTTGVQGLARVTVLEAEDARLTVAPITVFLRPRLDSTVDVLSAVSNPAGRLLSITDAVPRASEGSGLDVEPVDHRLLRITGSTVDGGSGVVGDVEYTVIDDSGESVTGVATVVMLADAPAARPIALDDAAVVRVGTQIDVPVLDNDVSADGAALQLDPTPSTLTADFGDGLAFVSNGILRLFAPAEAGEYTVSYTVYSASDPSKADTASVTVTVMPAGQNQDPAPRDLEGRVVAGQEVTLPFSAFGMDPDGDRVRLSRIVTQAEHGMASISPRSDGITYTALDPDFTGLDTFVFEVVDPDGRTGTATARVGVLGRDTASTPVTFTDYVQAQAGEDVEVHIDPVLNDLDPLGTDLVLTCFEPDVPGACGTAGVDSGADVESAAAELRALIVDPDAEGNARTLRAGTSPGTKVFVYQVASERTAYRSAYGYVVLDVVADPIPDAPQATDSYVSIADRAAFASSGIDVVSGNVTWLTGNVEDLQLSLVHAPEGYVAEGYDIRGPLPAATTVVPFQLSTPPLEGEEPATTYGFLVVPGENDIILGLSESMTAITVRENESVDFAIDQIVPVPADRALEVDTESLSSSLRSGSGATCAVSSAPYTVTYSAGQGKPYFDSCLVPVRLDGQKYFTQLLVPITIEAENPVPLLDPGPSLVVAPDPEADATVIDLMELVSWASTKEDAAGVQFSLDADLDSSAWNYDFDESSRTIRLTAEGSAREGTPGRIGVRFAGELYGSSDESTSIQLTVGKTPNVTPRGGVVSSGNGDCVSPEMTSCAVRVIGAPGEENYFSDSGPLKVVEVRGAANCPGVTFSVADASTVQARFPNQIDGMQCQTKFVVQDPSGEKHLSPPDKFGTINWDFTAAPRAPASIVQTAYDDRSITLSIDPGDAREAYPALQRYIVYNDRGQKVTCALQSPCQIRTDRNQEVLTYRAYAENSVGESTKWAQTTAYSYALPSVGDVQVTPVFDRARTTDNRGVVSVSISGSAREVTAYQITGSNSNVQRSGNGTTTVSLAFEVGPRQVTIVPVTSMEPPAGARGPRQSDATQQKSVDVAGLPSLKSAGTAKAAESSATVSGFAIGANFSAKPTQVLYFAYRASRPNCTVTDSGGDPSVSGGDAVVSAPNNPTITGLEPNEYYLVAACGSNGFGVVSSKEEIVYTSAPITTPPSIVYTVDYRTRTEADGTVYNDDGIYAFRVEESQAAASDPRFTPVWTNYNADNNTAANTGRPPGVSVEYCRQIPSYIGNYEDSYCVNKTDVTPAEGYGNRAFQLRVNLYDRDAVTCVAKSNLTGFGVTGFEGLGTVEVVSAVYRTDRNVVIEGANGAAVPERAASVESLRMQVRWTDGSVSGFPPFRWSVGSEDCSGFTPTPEDPPTSDPTNTPAP
jgi:hypothetical protein